MQKQHAYHALLCGGLMAVVGVLAATYALAEPTTGLEGSPGVLQEVWTGIKGNPVSELTGSKAYGKPPAQARILTEFAASDVGDDYGARYSAILSPPASGAYTFWVAADDSAELWLSTDAAPGNLRKIAFVASYVGEQEWTGRPSQKSSAVTLTEGGKYLIRVLHKEGGGGDHVAVAWESPGVARRVLGGAAVSVPQISKQLGTVLARARALEENVRRLSEIEPENVKAFLQGLQANDGKALAGELARLRKRVGKKPSSADRKQFAACVRLAAAFSPRPDSTISNPVARALLTMEDAHLKALSVDELAACGPHRAADAFGAIPAGAERVTVDLPLSSRDDKAAGEWVSTGLYAAPGEVVTVTIPAELTEHKLALLIGHQLSAKEKTTVYDCMPDTRRQFALDAPVTRAVSPHGGLLFVVVPKDVGLDQTPFRIAGAVRAPRFVLGVTSDEEWRRSVRQNPAPWGELVAPHIILLAHAPALRALDNPTALVAWWDANVSRHDGFYNHDRGMPFRMHVTHYPVRGVSTWPLYETKESVLNLLNLAKMRAYNDGLFLHEHGHHGDSGSMIFGNIGESTPNWAGYYMKGTWDDFAWKDTQETHMLALFDPNNSHHQEMTQDGWWTTKYTHYWSYPTTSLVVGYVEGFGWEAFKTAVHRFTHADDPVNKLPEFNTPPFKKKWWTVTAEDKKVLNQGKVDKWFIFLCEAAKHDVRPYFEHVCLRPSPEVAKRLDAMALPKWDLVYCPKRPVIVGVDEAVTIPSPLQYACAMSGELVLERTGKPEHGTLAESDDRPGHWVYTPSRGFRGRDTVPFTLTNQYGNVTAGTLEIFVAADAKNPRLYAGQLEDVSVDEWRSVRFPRSYRQPVVIASVVDEKDEKGKPIMVPRVAVRVRNVSPDGCEIGLAEAESEFDGVPRTLAWCVLEAGVYRRGESGITAEAGLVDMRPEQLSHEMSGLTRPYPGHIPMLRAARFGQVQTANAPGWSEFYWESVPLQCGYRFGAHHGLDTVARSAETIGFALLGQGLFQFGNQSVRVARTLTVEGTVLAQPRASLRDVRRRRRRELESRSG